MASSLRVLTLNCWGLPFRLPFNPDDFRAVRMREIAFELAKGAYDLVALQEVWDGNDYDLIRRRVQPSLPYSHYFHSGVMGSGVCVFSRWPIADATMHRYSLNGYAHHIHRGDWFGGKVVGLARICLPLGDARPPLRVCFYSTHVHAEYNRANDYYLPHRLLQSYELSQFVKHTSSDADLVLVTGDFNLEPVDLGLRLVCANAALLDAWTQRPDAPVEPHSSTCDRADNCFTKATSRHKFPDGKRIDYILYRARQGVCVEAPVCALALKKIPVNRHSTDVDYSDHAAVTAVFAVDAPADRGESAPPPSVELSDAATAALLEVTAGARRARRDQYIYGGYVLCMLVVLGYTIGIDVSYPAMVKLTELMRFLLSLCIGFCLWYGLVGVRLEMKGLRAAQHGLALLVRRPDDEVDAAGADPLAAD